LLAISCKAVPDKRRSLLVGKNKRRSSVLCASAVEVNQEGSRKMRSNWRKNWFIKRVALGLAIAAVAAPVAQAKMDEGSSVQANGYHAFVTDFPTSAGINESSKAMPTGYVLRRDPVELVRSEHRSTGNDVIAAAYGMPRAMPVDYAVNRGDQIELVRLQPRSTGDSFVASNYGMPRALPSDYALASGDQIEVVRALPQGTSSDKIEFVRTQPRSIGGPQVVASGFDWSDGAIGAGLALGLVLLGWGAALATRHAGRAQTA
jgi:hypothetical protein